MFYSYNLFGGHVGYWLWDVRLGLCVFDQAADADTQVQVEVFSSGSAVRTASN